ncbi:MAG: pyridoxamine 5'-phosphate oxidase family protein [Longimicrobiales bacterium]
MSTEEKRDKKLDELYDLIDGIEVAMLTTRRPDGRLVSRPMATLERARGADLWFATNIETHKIDELETDPHVNVAYYDPRSSEWVSVSGTARVSRNRKTVRQLYDPNWKAWLGKVDDDRDGGPDDPRIALIEIDADSVIYLKKDRAAPALLYEVAKGFVTAGPPATGEVRRVSRAELDR